MEENGEKGENVKPATEVIIFLDFILKTNNGETLKIIVYSLTRL